MGRGPRLGLEGMEGPDLGRGRNQGKREHVDGYSTRDKGKSRRTFQRPLPVNRGWTGLPGMGLPRLPFPESVCLEYTATGLNTRLSTCSSSPGQSTGEGRCAERPQLVPNGLHSDQVGEEPGGALSELAMPIAPVLPLLPTKAPRCRLHDNTPT